VGRVLIVAGSDSGGGAGIQADIKTVTMLGGYAATAVTALTAQDTRGVHGVFPVPAEFVRQQIGCVLDDLGADAIKTGMLGDAPTIGVVAEAMASVPAVPLVLDPVMVAKGGHRLLAETAVAALRERLLPLAAVVTPNVPEAEALTGRPVRQVEEMEAAAQRLLETGARAVLVKGGHLPGETVVDVLATASGVVRFEATRLDTRHTHGTGCTLAAGIAAGLAQGMTLEASVRRARAYLLAAMMAAPGLGSGHGPLGHGMKDFFF
jgi:hydroxymethylpyrimidine/phosphomethylpyrimidine kinase